MYTRRLQRPAALGLAGARARQVSADRHDGPYTEFLRRHEREAMQAVHGSKVDRERFAAQLLSRAGDPRNVMLAIEHCASRGQAAGPNGLRPNDLDKAARWELARALSPLIQDGNYLPSLPRTTMISKGRGRGERPIRIQNFEDRSTERTVLQVTRPMIEPHFPGTSFGFRYPGRSREEALAMAERLAYDLDRWVWITEDLKDAFEQVPTGRLLQILRRIIPADDICDFIGRIATDGNRGIRQGGPLSPELLNVYLHWMLDRWWQTNFPGVPMLRVADDLLILARVEEVVDLYSALADRARVIGMPLKGTATESIRQLATGDHADWLGYRIQRQEDGLRVGIADKSWDKLAEHLQLAWEEPIPPLAANDSIRGWISQQGAAYHRDLTEEALEEVEVLASVQGFMEIPRREQLASWWYQAYLRDWVWQRREVLLRVRRTELAEGFARQRWDFATISRRSVVEQPITAPPQTAPIRREVYLYCDGSCLGGARGVGGWAYLLVEPETGHREACADSHPRTTNNRMELTAVIRGLSILRLPTRVRLVLDSRYVFDGVTERLPDWIARRWRGRNGKRIANRQLWQRLAALLEGHDVECEWVRGHTGHAEHDEVDRMAREAAEQHLQQH